MQYMHTMAILLADPILNATNTGNRVIDLLRNVILPAVIIAMLIGALVTKRWVALAGVAILGGFAYAIAQNPGALADFGHYII